MSFHLFLFIATIPNCFPSLIRNLSIIQSSIFSLCLPLALFLPISASKMFFSIPPSLLSTYPTKVHCLLLIVFKSCHSTPTCSSTASLFSLSVHDILIILLQNHISAAISFCSMPLLIVHDTHPYNSTDQL